MTCPVLSATKGLKLDLNTRFRLGCPHCPPLWCGRSSHSCLSSPSGSALRALYQQHPLSLFFSPLFPLPPAELNPQQISELNLERVLEAFGAIQPCGHIPWRLSCPHPAGLARIPWLWAGPGKGSAQGGKGRDSSNFKFSPASYPLWHH